MPDLIDLIDFVSHNPDASPEEVADHFEVSVDFVLDTAEHLFRDYYGDEFDG
jgi:hypothetical protein